MTGRVPLTLRLPFILRRDREVLENPCAENFVLFQIGLLREYWVSDHSTAQHDTAQHDAAQHDSTQHSMPRHDTTDTPGSMPPSFLARLDLGLRSFLTSLISPDLLISDDVTRHDMTRRDVTGGRVWIRSRPVSL